MFVSIDFKSMSHVKEIKRKQEIQARFQLALNNTSSHVSSWLRPLDSKHQQNDTSIDKDVSKLDFLNLPIISGSSGLSLSGMNPTGGESDINTIGDYVKTGKSLNSLKNKRIGIITLNNKVTKSSSKALQALQNKIRKSNVNKIQKKSNNGGSISDAINGKKEQQYKNDSDSEEEVVQRSTKKSFSLLIDSKIKKKKN